MDWRVQFSKGALKSTLPFKNEFRGWRARRSSAPVPAHFAHVIDGALAQVQQLRAMGFDLEGKHALEIGTGWYPIMPLIYRLAGAERVCLTDTEPLLHAINLFKTIDFMRLHRGRICEGLGIGIDHFDRLFAVPPDNERDAALSQLGLDYLVIDPGWSRVPPVDVIFSHTCLEHIPPQILEQVMAHSRRVLRPGGLVSHGVDNSDHRASVDPRLSRIDFLRYSDRAWRLLCIDPLDYTNRLRHSDYVRMFNDTGWELLYNQPMRDSRIEREAASIPLWGRFKGLSDEDLQTTWSHFVARVRSN